MSSCLEPFEVRARLDALFPETQDEFFKFTPLAALNRTAAMFRKLGRSYDLRELHRATMDIEERRFLLCQYLEGLGLDWSGLQRHRLPTTEMIKAKLDQAGIVDEVASLTWREIAQPAERYQQTMSKIGRAHV